MEKILLKSIGRKFPLNLRIGCESTFPLGNCSIIPYYDTDLYFCAVREFYYFLKNEIYEHPYGSYVKLGMKFCFLDKDFYPLPKRYKFILNWRANSKDYTFEDPRLFRWDDKIFLSCSAINPKMQNPYGRVATQVFSVDISSKQINLCGIFNSRKYISDKECEKNWMAVQGRTGEMVQMVCRNGVNVVNVLKKTTQLVPSKIELPSNLRGNTPLMSIDDGKYLCIVHWRSGDNHMDYYHNFIVFDKNLQIESISKPFKFDNVFPTEFCSSMFNLIDSSQIGITVCENDCFQYLYVIEKDKLLEFIKGGEQKPSLKIDKKMDDI